MKTDSHYALYRYMLDHLEYSDDGNYHCPCGHVADYFFDEDESVFVSMREHLHSLTTEQVKEHFALLLMQS